jgi:hypothetical protein
MKHAQWAVAALVLLVGGALGVRLHGGTPSSPDSAPTPAPSSAPRPDPAVANLAGAPAGSLTLRWMGVLEQSLKTPPATPAQEELLRSEEREFAGELKKRLAEDPARWDEVLEVISQEDPRIGRKVVGGLKDGVADAAEPRLLQALKEGRHREIRLSAATLVAGRKSSESFWGLLSAAQEDIDAGVRYKCLTELAGRQGRASSTESSTLQDLLRMRGRVDPDPGVRQLALRLSGQPSESATRPPSPAPKKDALPASPTSLR